MYLEAIRIFCDVVRQRSFSRAAAMNHVSQSAASQNVLQLERSLGVRLLDRSKRPFTLTPEGQVYYNGCKMLVEQYAAVEAQVRSLRNGVSGVVNVAAIYSVGLSGMSRYVQRFAQLYPEARVHLAYLHPDRVAESVAAEEMDLGLLSYPRGGRELVAVPWCEEPMVVACPPGHRLSGRSTVTAADLAGEPFVAFSDTLTIRREVDGQLRRHRCEVQVVMAFDNIETIKRAVEIGEGLAILPAPTIQTEVAAGSLVAVPLDRPRMIRPLGIIHRRRLLTPTEQAFIDVILDRQSVDESRPVERPVEDEPESGRRAEGLDEDRATGRRSIMKATV